MARSSEFVTHVLDQLASYDRVEARRMFGGHGIFQGGTMIGLIAEDVFYLKVDAHNQPAFEAAGSSPFTYRRRGRGKAIAMSYWEVPADVLEDREALSDWAREAHAAARRTNKRRSVRRRSP